MSKKVTLEELIDFKTNYCDKFFPSNLATWSTVVLLECSKDRELMEEIKGYISIDSDSVTAEELDSIMQELRNKTNACIDSVKDASSKEEFYRVFTRGLVYYGVLESLDELASFSTNLISAIREKYGDRYLDVISKFDKSNLSIDGGKVLEQTSIEDVYSHDELLQKYRVLKEWQDKQHGFYQTVIEPTLMKMWDEYDAAYPLPLEVGFESPLMIQRFYELCQKDLLTVDELAECYLCGMDSELVKLVGGKAYGLAKLRAAGLNVPKTYVVPVTAKDFDYTKYPELSDKVHYAVRSSADIEDGKSNSFAGMFDSYLDVPVDGLEDHIKKVVASKNNSRLQQYIETNGLDQPNMAVVLQHFVEPEYAGVWMGKNGNSGYLEYVDGNGEKLVSGQITPEREVWEDGECKGKRLTCNGGDVGELLLEYQRAVTGEDGEVADFEWMILDNELVMLQYRPVTSKLDMAQVMEVDEEGVYRGIPASPGVVSGPCRFVNARLIDQLTDWRDGDILMAWFTDPEWMNILSHSSGIVTAVGGFLCHAAIIARELGIPCVIGIGGDNMKKIWEETELTIDGTNGTVKAGPVLKKTPQKK